MLTVSKDCKRLKRKIKRNIKIKAAVNTAAFIL